MDAHYQRALVLIQQGRWELAEKELRQCLADDPNDALSHTFLALSLLNLDRLDEATGEIQTAIRLTPDLPGAHYTHGQILFARRRYDEAEQAVREALRLDPEDADYYSLLAAIHFNQRQWQPTLEAAEQGLQRDAEHIQCNNFRAMALTKLGRTAEASATMAATLARDPEDSFSHANQGWNYLHEGNKDKALEHFREALRQDPANDYARTGMVEALKAKYLLYGLLLRYFLWMGRLGGRAQWGVIIGAYLGYRLLRAIAVQQPQLGPILWPILIAYIIFAGLTWLASPLFNLLLRLNRFGRHALSSDERLGSTCVGLALVPALGGLALWLVCDSDLALLAAMYFGFLLLPISAIFKCPRGWPRWGMILYTAALAGAGMVFFAMLETAPASALLAWQIFLWGSVLSGIVANLLIGVVVRR